jgi:hypothetical protein
MDKAIQVEMKRASIVLENQYLECGDNINKMGRKKIHKLKL